MQRWLTNLENFKALNDRERLLSLIRYATYAPSSHNTQPWLFKIDKKTIEILPNFKRRLVASDPNDRQLYISLGAAAYNITASSLSLGLSFKKSIRQEFERISIFFEFESVEPKQFNADVLKSIIERENSRVPFLDKPLDAKLLGDLKGQIQTRHTGLELLFKSDKETKSKLINIFSSAFAEAFSEKAFTSELSLWLKSSRKKHQDGMPGYNLGVPWLLSFFLPWMVKNLNIAKPQVKMNRELLESAPVLAIITTPDDTPAGWINVGEAVEDLFILITQNGLKMGLFTAPIEISHYYTEMQKVANTRNRPQVFLRAGFAEKSTSSSPRLSQELVIIE